MTTIRRYFITAGISIFLPLAITACQPQAGGGNSMGGLDGRVKFSSPIRQLKPECSPNEGGKFSRANLAKCLDPTYVKLAGRPLSAEQVTAAISGKTQRSYSEVHGTQVWFNAPDGSVYLWYPGNRAILKGEWKVVADQKTNAVANFMNPSMNVAGNNSAYLCYRYGANTYNPATRTRGSVWECQNAAISLRHQTKETAEGDIFGLASGNLPFVMEKENFTFAKLKQQ